MDKRLEEPMDFSVFLQKMRRKPGASEDSIRASQAAVEIMLPLDYLDFMRLSNGADGPVGVRHISIWPLEVLAGRNEGYDVKSYAPGLLLFGSDGGDTAYAFDCRNSRMEIVETPFIGMSLEATHFLARTFSQFLAYLSKSVS